MNNVLSPMTDTPNESSRPPAGHDMTETIPVPPAAAAGVAPDEPPVDATQPLPPPTGTGMCPKCKWRLIDPDVMGYCPACGYCRYTEEARRRLQVPAAPPVRPEVVALSGALRGLARLPAFFGVLLVGAFAVLLYTKALSQSLAPDSYARALTGILLMAAGLMGAGMCQFWALVKVAPHHEELTISAVLMRPLLIWQTAFHDLPTTRWPIWVGLWSLALLAGSAMFIGGQGYWVR